MKIRPGIELANLTDVGCERAENEDYYAYVEPESDEEFARRGRLAVIADGMGGHAGGRVASVLAVEAVRDTYLGADGTDPKVLLEQAVTAAHCRIREAAAESPELEGMGSTCIALAVRDGHFWYAHVGDSRLYLLRDSALARLTEDHSYVRRLVASGVITEEEAATHPQRNVLTAALGMDGDVEADFPAEAVPLKSGDKLLLTTDGLHGLVSDGEILELLDHNTPAEACRLLVDAAKAKGGHDNITVQVLEVN